MNAKASIAVFEHEKLFLNEVFTEVHLHALQRFVGNEESPYFKLLNRGVQFKQFVGVLQVGKLTIEVLPKIDKTTTDKGVWKEVLIDMLRYSGLLDIHVPSSSSLKLKSNFILDVYIELFLYECENLLKKGLVKKYHKTEGNLLALKGSLQFGRQIKENLVHQERFYCRYITYDKHHVLNQILYKTLNLIHHINCAPLLVGKINQLLLDFPEMEDIRVNEATFSKIVLNRKTQPYQKALEIARLLLLNYHPDVVRGQNHVLALMFDMNNLWELFIYRSLLRSNREFKQILYQKGRQFWETKLLKPDIRLISSNENLILDTKWKLPNDLRPSDADLKQMFAYNLNFNVTKSFLVYPFSQTLEELITGSYHYNNTSCSLLFINILKNNRLDREVGKMIFEKLKF